MISQEFVDRYNQKTPPWGFDGMGEVVFLRTYSRKKEDGQNETLAEVIQRVINGAIRIGTPYTQEEAEALFDHMFNLRCSTSGRALWQMGTPLVDKFGGASLQNCYFVNIDSVESFEMLFSYLMLGGGVGFSVEREKIHDFPKVKTNVSISHKRTNDADFIVADSREGWGRLLHGVLKSYFYTGKSFDYSTILIREYGAPLKTFGGTASGPGELIEGIQQICSVLEGRAGKKIRSVDALDIGNIIGKIVVSGSSRRSAEIALGDPDDILFLRAKNWASGDIPAWRENSNNSIYADSYDELIPQFWKSYDGSGEPYGLMNRKLMRKVGRLGELRPDPSIEGMNPCVTEDTWILTSEGPRRVNELLRSSFMAVVDGQKYPASAFWETGVKNVLQLITNDGQHLRLTENHKVMTPAGWVEAGNLEVGDAVVLHDHTGFVWDGDGTNDEGYLLGHLVGDGTFSTDQPHVAIWTNDAGHLGPKNRLSEIVGSLPHRSDFKGWRQVADTEQWRLSTASMREIASRFGIYRFNKTITDSVESASSDFTKGFLRGLFDTDGHIEGDTLKGGVSVRLSQSNLELLRSAQRMLGRLGINSSIRNMKPAGTKEMPGGTYDVQASFRLILSGSDAQKFVDTVGFEDSVKLQKWNDATAEMKRGFYKKQPTWIAEILNEGPKRVFDCSVEEVHAFDANGFYVHNCGEIGLANGESCNLATIALPNVDSKEQLLEISRLLYMMQKQITELPFPFSKTTDITRKNRRLGQNITGWAQISEEKFEWAREAYEELVELDGRFSEEHGIPRSIRLTTVQPGGTQPLVLGVLSATGPAHSEFYIRRIRFRSDDPLVVQLRKRGHNVSPEVGLDGKINHTRLVVDFPCKTSEGALLTRDTTAIAQMELIKKVQTIWADNAISATVYYRKDELPGIKQWLAENYEDCVKSMSFLLHSDHGFLQAPIEEISKEEYLKLSSRLDLSVPLQGQFMDEMVDIACDSGSCPVR